MLAMCLLTKCMCMNSLKLPVTSVMCMKISVEIILHRILMIIIWLSVGSAYLGAV